MALPRSSKWLVFGALVALVLAWAWWPSCEGDGSVKDVLACSQVNRNYGLMVAGLFALVALYLNWQRTANDRRRTVNDTYVKAVEQLGHDKMEVRLGAIYALERIAATDRDYHWPIMETLCAYIRERPASGWRRNAETGQQEAGEPEAGTAVKEASSPKSERRRPPTDIQAILRVFARRSDARKAWEKSEDLRLDLRHLRWGSVDLAGVDLEYADLRGSDISRSNFHSANLRDTLFWNGVLNLVNMTKIDLSGSQLNKAKIRYSIIEDANISKVNLEHASLNGSQIRKSNFTNSYLKDADLRNIVLCGSSLNHANLEGAKFSQHPSKLGAEWDEDNPPRNRDKIVI